MAKYSQQVSIFAGLTSHNKNKREVKQSMEMLSSIISDINGVVWGPLMLVLILGVGLFLMLGLRLMPLLRIGTGFSLLWEDASHALAMSPQAKYHRFKH